MKAKNFGVRLMILSVILFFGTMFFGTKSFAQQEEEPFINVSADLVSRYIWRGWDFGNAPAVQPGIDFSMGNFNIGAWGSYALSAVPYLEADVYISYAFDFGLDLILTDYYFPSAMMGVVTDDSYFDIDAHIIESGLVQEIGDFYLSAYYWFNAEDDIYFEAGYSFNKFDLFMGAGNKSYTSDGQLMITNIGISTIREIRLSETFNLPLTGAFIINPDLEQVHIVVGISL